MNEVDDLLGMIATEANESDPSGIQKGSSEPDVCECGSSDIRRTGTEKYPLRCVDCNSILVGGEWISAEEVSEDPKFCCNKCGTDWSFLFKLNPEGGLCDTCEWETRATRLNAENIALREVLGATEKYLIAHRNNMPGLMRSSKEHLDRAKEALQKVEDAIY